MSSLLLRGQLAALTDEGFDVSLLCSPGQEARRLAESEGVRLVACAMAREISLQRDLKSFIAIVRLLRRLHPDVVNASTPKAGLLVSLASFLTRNGVRVYTLRGLRLETERGLRRYLLWVFERLTTAVCHKTICISPSLAARAVELKVVKQRDVVVFGSGSSNGVNADYFSSTAENIAVGRDLRTRLEIPANAFVVGYVGRLAADKGIDLLWAAWKQLQSTLDTAAHLVMAGEAEPGDDRIAKILPWLAADPQVHLLGHKDDVRFVYSMMDVLVLPSQREGFGNVLIEAGAMEKPVIASRIPGCIDAVAHGVTGLLVPVGDASALTDALMFYAVDRDAGKRHGKAGRARCLQEFEQRLLWRRMAILYRELLEACP